MLHAVIQSDLLQILFSSIRDYGTRFKECNAQIALKLLKSLFFSHSTKQHLLQCSPVDSLHHNVQAEGNWSEQCMHVWELCLRGLPWHPCCGLPEGSCFWRGSKSFQRYEQYNVIVWNNVGIICCWWSSTSPSGHHCSGGCVRQHEWTQVGTPAEHFKFPYWPTQSTYLLILSSFLFILVLILASLLSISFSRTGVIMRLFYYINYQGRLLNPCCRMTTGSPSLPSTRRWSWRCTWLSWRSLARLLPSGSPAPSGLKEEPFCQEASFRDSSCC